MHGRILSHGGRSRNRNALPMCPERRAIAPGVSVGKPSRSSIHPYGTKECPPMRLRQSPLICGFPSSRPLPPLYSHLCPIRAPSVALSSSPPLRALASPQLPPLPGRPALCSIGVHPCESVVLPSSSAFLCVLRGCLLSSPAKIPYSTLMIPLTPSSPPAILPLETGGLSSGGESFTPASPIDRVRFSGSVIE